MQESGQMVIRKQEQKRISVIFAGMAGSGKSTIARNIAEIFNLRYLCGGDALQEMAREKGFNPTGEGWWETEDGMKFLAMRDQDPQFDQRVDEFLIENVRRGGVSITSWAVPWLIPDGFKVYLKASQESRAKRITGRDNISYLDSIAAVKKRDVDNIELYKKLYGHHIADDLDNFDLIVETDDKNIKQVTEVVVRALNEFLQNPRSNLSGV